MKKALLLTFLGLYLLLGFFGCSGKSVTHSEPTEPKEEKEIDDLSSLNACTAVYCLQRKGVNFD